MSQEINQIIKFDAKPSRIYQALTDAQEFEKVSGAPTEIDASPGGAFSCFGGMIIGRNVECISSSRLVQAWRVKAWEPGFHSIVEFHLEPDGEGTKLTLRHAGFPNGQAEHLSEGWHTNYWKPLQQHFA